MVQIPSKKRSIVTAAAAVVATLATTVGVVSSFTLSSTTTSSNARRSTNSKLLGIAEWRDDVPIATPTAAAAFDSISSSSSSLASNLIQLQQQIEEQQQYQSTVFSSSTYNLGSAMDEQQPPPQEEEARSIPLLIVPSEQVAVMGETKYFHFVSNEEVRLFQQAVDHHRGVFAVGYVTTDDFAIVDDDEDIAGVVAESNQMEQHPQQQQQNQAEEVLLDRLALMEITNYRYMDHNVDMGIICTAQAVGRATLKRVEAIERSSKSSSSSSKKNDDKNCNSDFHLAAICNEYFDETEDLYTLRDANEMARNVVKLISQICEVEQHQLHLSHLSDGEDDEEESRKDRFCTAIRDAYESDSQGYHFIQENKDDNLRISSSSSSLSSLKSWKELNAVSWAAYSSSANLQWDETYRLHALDMNSITNRLKLAEFWLLDKLLETKHEFIHIGSNDEGSFA
eukprot:CAMPEP_0113524838 /NCGR_PEP_ID=MMETSP0014_2-20120614/46422_1 /TAXON_ID=2857 /ORGANISM="Nitzschia sp." /LENGTH=452 /DNA_ID=CAMNT_0000422961 /DNA_START=384 /DNA_END=1742 /DNA_ORIENTATION=- /assembly_acc=CAM_ASM_000159